MTLIKPTRREIVTAAADQARRELWLESEAADRRANELQQRIAESRNQLADAKLQSARDTAKAIEEETNALLARHGFDRCIGVELSRGMPGQPVELQLQLLSVCQVRWRRLRAKHPRDTKKIEKLVAEEKQLRQDAQRLRETARALHEEDVVKGAVGQALGAEEAAALELLVKAIKEVSLNAPETLADARAIADARIDRR